MKFYKADEGDIDFTLHQTIELLPGTGAIDLRTQKAVYRPPASPPQTGLPLTYEAQPLEDAIRNALIHGEPKEGDNWKTVVFGELSRWPTGQGPWKLPALVDLPKT